MAIHKEIKVVITVRELESDSQRISDCIDDEIKNLTDYFFYAPECVAEEKEKNTYWGCTLIGTVPDIKAAYTLDNKLKNFIYRNCKHLIIEE
jgi:hypothetical protein